LKSNKWLCVGNIRQKSIKKICKTALQKKLEGQKNLEGKENRQTTGGSNDDDPA